MTNNFSGLIFRRYVRYMDGETKPRVDGDDNNLDLTTRTRV